MRPPAKPSVNLWMPVEPQLTPQSSCFGMKCIRRILLVSHIFVAFLGLACIFPVILFNDWTADMFKDAVKMIKMTSETRYELMTMIDHYIFSIVTIDFGAVCFSKVLLVFIGVIMKSQAEMEKA